MIRLPSVLRANLSKVKDLDLDDRMRAYKDVAWKSFRDIRVRGAKDAAEGMRRMRRDPAAGRRDSLILAAVGAAIGAAFMYFWDPTAGNERRSSARERFKRWYLSGRGQLDHAWRQLQSQSPAFDLTEKPRTGDDPGDAHDRSSREATAARSD